MERAHQRPATWVIVVAAGSGTRFGAPKQFHELEGRRIIDRSIEGAARHADGVVAVLPADALTAVAGIAGPDDTPVVAVVGDESRAGSVRRGLAVIPDEVEIIVVHDGARPLADDLVYTAVIDAVVAGADAVVPGLDISDTLRFRAGGTVDRAELVAVQTPQAFAARALRSAHSLEGEATDDATLVEASGGDVELVPGDPRNIKITTPLDLELASALLAMGPDPDPAA